MTTAAAVQTIGHEIAAAQFRSIPLTDIEPSPSNPRKTFAGIDELAADFKIRGVLLPLIVRPKAKGFECVAGERRLRAAKLAKLATVPAIVRELSDLEVLEIQIVENAKRQDIHPVEEAEAYRALRDVHKLSVAEISAKVGRPVGTVYERLKLCELAPEVRKAALAGELPASHAVLIARIPDKKLQAEALGRMKQWDGAPVSYRAALDLVHHNFMLQLDGAQWDKKDATLVPAAGACSTCVKRTGNQPELFSDVKSKDTCTDPACFQSKKEAFVKLTVATAKSEGKKVLEAGEAKDYFGHQAGRAKPTLIDLDEKDYNDAKQRTWREKLGKKAPASVLAVDDAAKVHELVPRKEVEKALPKKEAPKREVGRMAQGKVQEERLKLREAVVAAAFTPFLAAAAKKPDDALRFVVADGLDMVNAEDARLIAAACGIATDKPEDMEKRLKGLIEKAEIEQLAAIALGLMVADNAAGSIWGDGYGEPFASTCKLLKIDLKKLEGAERLKRKAEAKASSKKPASKPTKPTKKK